MQVHLFQSLQRQCDLWSLRPLILGDSPLNRASDSDSCAKNHRNLCITGEGWGPSVFEFFQRRRFRTSEISRSTVSGYCHLRVFKMLEPKQRPQA